MPCPAGTYRPAGAASCLPCTAGRAAAREGAAACATCAAGSFSDGGFECEACPAGSTSLFPGATSAAACLPAAELEARLDAMFDQGLLVTKLVDMPALQTPERPKPRCECRFMP